MSDSGGATPAQSEKMLAALADAAAALPLAPHRNATAFLDGLIHQLDQQISDQLNQVIHAEPFLKLEGAWRGLQKLVNETDTNKTLWVEVLDASREELSDDLATAAAPTDPTATKSVTVPASSLQHSTLWQKVYENRFDVSGAKPLGAIVSGLQFDNSQEDVALLDGLGRLGSAAQAPVIASASPRLLGLSSFARLKITTDPGAIFQGPAHERFRELRRQPHARFLALTLPRTLARLPWGSQTAPADDLRFEEAPLDHRTAKPLMMPHDHLCWSSSAYAYAAVLTRAFRQTNWCTNIVGDERLGLSGGAVTGLPRFTYLNEGGNLQTYCPTETIIPGHKEFALAELGLLPLSYEVGSSKAVFVGGKTVYEPVSPANTPAYRNEFAASVLPNVLPAARIAHFMKAIGRRFHGRFTTTTQLRDFVHNWLANFKTDPGSDDRGKIAHPLRDFKVTVTESTAPGTYHISLDLAFWTMVQQINADVRIVAEVDRYFVSSSLQPDCRG